MKKILIPLAILLFPIVVFFKPFFMQGKLPIPADTIVGLYHPFRDLYAADYPNGIAYKNFLTTDPVRQQYPWRLLAISEEKEGILPLWNPYTLAGTPLVGTFQSAAFYPLNLLLFLLPFSFGWSVLIVLQQILASSFLYLYLTNLKLKREASLLGAFVFAFSGVFIAWLEWGTLGHVAAWLPLILLSIDKLFSQDKKKSYLLWALVFVFSLTAAFFAGHLQVFFYVVSVSVAYFIARWIQQKKPQKILLVFIALTVLFLLITAIQWIPTFQFISQSARDIDQINWRQTEGWFIPWQHLAQFFAPDFFGNPTTLNYWGVWNYGEFVGYVGIFPLVIALFALFFRRDKKTLFFGLAFILSILFALPTIFAQIPYQLQLPFLSTSQPTRLLFIADFSLAVLAALGLDYYLKVKNKKKILAPVIFVCTVMGLFWAFVLFGSKAFSEITPENILTTKRNLYFPTILLGVTMFLLLSHFMIKRKRIQYSVIVLLLLLTVFDLFRFAQKFTPFSDPAYLFPSTQALSYLQKQPGQFRLMTTDAKILPPNFSTVYQLQTIDGYDPLYLRRTGELIAAIERNKPDITPPFGFNRIINPHNYDSRLIDLLGVHYVLSLTDITSPKLEKVFGEGETRVYKNKQAFPRAFFVTEVTSAKSKQEAIGQLFDPKNDLRKKAVVEEWEKQSFQFVTGSVKITSYTPNNIVVETINKKEGFLVFVDAFYPTWHAKICSMDENDCFETKIYLTDYNFRGIVVPQGNHRIIFYNTLL